MDSSISIGLQRVIAQSSEARHRQEDAKRWSDHKVSSDEGLLVKIGTGDKEALGLLFRRYAAIVRNIGQRILRDKAEADDLVQEVFLYLNRKSGLFDGAKGSGRSWIVQVAYTQALLRRRELKARESYVSGIADKQVEKHQGGNQEGTNY